MVSCSGRRLIFPAESRRLGGKRGWVNRSPTDVLNGKALDALFMI
jgi:hypothetical protein